MLKKLTLISAIAALAAVTASAALAGSTSFSSWYGSASASAAKSVKTVTVKATVDTAGSTCSYVEAKIVVASAPDPNLVVVTDCGGAPNSATWTQTINVGTPQYVELKYCRDSFGIDPCTVKTVNL